MKLYQITALGLAALLAACGQKTENDEAATANASANMAGEMSEMGNMEMPAATSATRMAKGTGTVTAIDEAEGSITIDHAPIPEAGWPAMVMAFKAKPELLGEVKVGDKVMFDLALKDGGGEITAVQEQ